MTRIELVEHVAKSANVSKRAAEEAVTATINGIEDSLAKGDGISLQGFGSFTVKQRGERIGRNPQSGEQITIPAKKVCKFKSSKALAAKINA